MSFGFCKHAIKCRGKLLPVISHLKRSVVEVRAEENCLTHALIIAIAKLDKDSIYAAFRKGRKKGHVVRTLFETTGIYLSNGAAIPEIVRFHEHIREYNVVVYHCLKCGNIMFVGKVDSAKNLIYCTMMSKDIIM